MPPVARSAAAAAEAGAPVPSVTFPATAECRRSRRSSTAELRRRAQEPEPGTHRPWTGTDPAAATTAPAVGSAPATRPTTTSVDLREGRQGRSVARRPTAGRRRVGRRRRPGRPVELHDPTTGTSFSTFVRPIHREK